MIKSNTYNNIGGKCGYAVLILLAIFCSTSTFAEDDGNKTLKFEPSMSAVEDTVSVENGSEKKKKKKKKNEPKIPHLNVDLEADDLDPIQKTVRGFSAVDTNYIEPQHYNWSFMLQSTFNYDVYWLTSRRQSLMLSPDVLMRVGPYFGWRWLFLGTTFELKNFDLFGSKNGKKEFTLSIYSSQLGVDLFYRRTGNDYKIRQAKFSTGNVTSYLEGVDFGGLNVGITGANVYYIFNHNRFSYPAAYAQSTCQKISCGSWMAGIGYTRQSLELDYEMLKDVVDRNTPDEVLIDSGLMFDKITYYDLNFSVGYSYNWVFAKDWLLNGSASLALAYKQSNGDNSVDERRDFDFSNFNVDGIFRAGLVYNNTKWYCGANAIMHMYTYRKSRFSANNFFGSLNIYLGVNFGLKEGYQKFKKRKKR